jgi:hypothetical protein
MLDSHNSEEIFEQPRGELTSKLLAGACALAVAAILVAGYLYLRKRHAMQHAAVPTPVQNASVTAPKGPPKLHVLLDDPMLKGSETLIGGTVKNISQEELSNVTVELELRRRKDGNVEQKSLLLEPSLLRPDEEGRYSIKLLAQEYGGVRLLGLRSGPDLALLAYTSGPGLKRPLERTESKTIVVQRPASKGDEFINTPDNPGRVR